MPTARMVPLLPCGSLDAAVEFAEQLGFELTYHQTRPNPYAALRWGEVDLHYFELPELRPEDSYSTCLLVVDDVVEVHARFTAGLRAARGSVPISGFPRVTRPRRRKNADGHTGFSVVDPAGNWIRVTADRPSAADDAVDAVDALDEGPLAEALANAVVQGDSRGDLEQAAKVISGALRRHAAAAPSDVVLEALAYAAEIAVRSGDEGRARDLLAQADEPELAAATGSRAGAARDQLAELRATLTASDPEQPRDA